MKRPSYFGYFRSRWPNILLMLLFTGISTVGNFVETLFVSDIVDKVQNAEISKILWLATILLGIECGSRLFAFGAEKFALGVKEVVIKNLHLDLAKALANSSVESVSRQEPAKITEKVNEAKNFVDAVYGIFQASFTLVGGIAAMLYISYCAWQVAILLMVFMGVFLWNQFSFREKLVAHNVKAKGVTDESKQLLLEIVSGFADVKVQNLVRGLKVHLLNAHDNEVRENIETERKLFRNALFTQVLVAIYKFLFLIVTVVMFKEGQVTYAEFLALYMYKGHVQQAASGILQIFKHSAMIHTSIQRMDEVLNYTSLEEAKWGRENELPQGPITIEEVTATLGGKKILHAVNCFIPQGALVGIVGPSGSGKSTLLKVLAHEVPIELGEIRVGDTSLSSLTEEAYRKLIRMAPQQPFLFSTLSIRENLMAANPEATDEQIWEALRLCRADDFVRNHGGLDATISVKSLSGGERQRLALARTILSGGKIILLDESTSALDAESQAAIMETVLSAKRMRTILMVAHRVSTLKDADIIFFMKNGRIADSGTYEELLNRNPEFLFMAEQG